MNEIILSLDAEIEEVIRHYANMVYKLAYSRTGSDHDADDVFQEVFLRYVRKNPTFRGEEHRKAWLIRVTLNCSNNFWNTPWKKKMVEMPEEMVYEEGEMIDLYYELQKLPTKYREVIHLFYYEQMSLEEISMALKRKNSTVRTQLTRARAILRSFLEEEDYDY